MTCPNCGKEMTRVEYSSVGGVRRESLCCHVGLDILENWAMFEVLPEELLTAALEADARQAEAFFERVRLAGLAANDRLAAWQAENREQFTEPVGALA